MESLFPGQPRMGNTKSAAISAFAAELYVGGSGSGSGSGSGGPAVFPVWTEYVRRLNEVLGWDGRRAITEPWSFQVFVECG